MPTAQKAHRLTVSIEEPEISDAIRQLADQRHPSMRQLVAVLRKWLEDREMELDRLAAEQVLKDIGPTTTLEDLAKSRGWHD